jgi:DNA replication and repair protein RecF
VQLVHLQLKNFRCFNNFQVDFHSPIVIIKGNNGTGKTSLLEALHYGCYLRSFRTHIPRDLAYFGSDNFFVKLTFIDQDNQSHEIQLGFAGQEKLVKIDKKPVTSYRELLSLYQVITVTEEDIELIRGGPELRRSFIDQALTLIDPTYIQKLRTLRGVVDNRNTLLKNQTVTAELLEPWNIQLERVSKEIRTQRIILLKEFSSLVTELTHHYFSEHTIQFSYRTKEQAAVNAPAESIMKRTLWGAHLDDIIILLNKQSCRDFSSRGQQKLVALLIKMAYAQRLVNQAIHPLILLDDFMTDFDATRITILMKGWEQLGCPLIITTPLQTSPLADYLSTKQVQEITLTS